MRILAIETSCDETAASVVDCQGELAHLKAEVLSHVVHSQAELHAEYGGVFPNLAKREHVANIAAVVAKAIEGAVKAEARAAEPAEVDVATEAYFRETVSREPGLAESLLDLVRRVPKPDIELVSVTQGPGLEPALWVGIGAAKCLAKAWNVPIVGADHMLGHIAAAQIGRDEPVPFPALAALASGGHTELAWATGWDKLEVIGETRDDAIGEAYDKVARVLGLPYPGGPEVSKLATAERANPSGRFPDLKLPRPMIGSGDLDFSLSGLKTAVLYAVRDQAREGGGAVSPEFRAAVAREFEEAVADVLVAKVRRACEERGPKAVIAGGGVFANAYIRSRLADAAREAAAEPIFTPTELATDNATMVALSGYICFLAHGPDSADAIRANGSQRLGSRR
jgi:glycoprotease/Kae1 family metallohydrolase